MFFNLFKLKLHIQKYLPVNNRHKKNKKTWKITIKNDKQTVFHCF